MPDPIRLAVLVRTQLAYGRGVTRGIARYARRHAHWRLHAMVMHDPEPPRGWVADAGIGHLPPGDWCGLVPPHRPRVYIGYSSPPDAARVLADEPAVGAMGVDHLLGLGFRHLAFVGRDERAAAFHAALAERGERAVAVPPKFCRSSVPQWPRLLDDFAAWLQTAPKPLGIMAMHDVLARQVSLGCRLAGLRVPDDVAVLGVDNDELLCELSDPPLSSVEQGLQQIGFEAARLVDDLLRGDGPRTVTVPPRRVAPRRSTHVLAVRDDDVAAAVRYIRAHAHEPITIDDVAAAIPAARRTLERRFGCEMGHTMHQELQQARVRRAQDLLVQSDEPLHQIAAACGYPSLNHFHEVFRRLTQKTPAAFRREHRTH